MKFNQCWQKSNSSRHVPLKSLWRQRPQCDRHSKNFTKPFYHISILTLLTSNLFWQPYINFLHLKCSSEFRGRFQIVTIYLYGSVISSMLHKIHLQKRETSGPGDSCQAQNIFSPGGPLTMVVRYTRCRGSPNISHQVPSNVFTGRDPSVTARGKVSQNLLLDLNALFSDFQLVLSAWNWDNLNVRNSWLPLDCRSKFRWRSQTLTYLCDSAISSMLY